MISYVLIYYILLYINCYDIQPLGRVWLQQQDVISSVTSGLPEGCASLACACSRHAKLWAVCILFLRWTSGELTWQVENITVEICRTSLCSVVVHDALILCQESTRKCCRGRLGGMLCLKTLNITELLILVASDSIWYCNWWLHDALFCLVMPCLTCNCNSAEVWMIFVLGRTARV